uniref:EF-hand domain-containing protein n=1 Tax=Araucaria cunninghamii TaxID=56994 RepID=A0A0D6R5H2_ARACU
MGSGGFADFLPDNSMIVAILRTVLLYGVFSSLVGYLLPKRFKVWFSDMSAVEEKKSGVAAEQKAEDLAEDLAEEKKGVGRGELQRVFSTFDKNGDGRISRQEMAESLEKLGLQIAEDEVASAIRDVDANGDGHVDFEEFVAFYEAVLGKKDNGDNLEDSDLTEAFAVFDGNGDGVITVEELQSVMRSLGLKEGRTAAECQNMISKVDRDGDGKVNYEEFKEMMKTAFGQKN